MTNTTVETSGVTNDNAIHTSPNGGPRTYHGACVCGAVRFEADIDLQRGTIRCNCSICVKGALWSATIAPTAFRLLSGEENLTDYQRGAKIGHFVFCKTCGVRPFSRGDAPWMNGPYVSVQLLCLEDADLTDVPVTYVDGRQNAWQNQHSARGPAKMI